MKYLLLFYFLVLFSTNLVAQPQNDDCEGAIDLGSIPYCESTIFTNINATPSDIGTVNIPECFNGGIVNNDVWFKFSVPTNGSIENIKITLTSADTSGILNPQLALYRGICEPDQLSELGVCQSAIPGQQELILEAIGLKTNTQYFLRINDFSATATPNWGDFTICIEELAPFFIMGESTGTGLCEGTLFDSGDRDGDYQILEDTFFTICPTQFNRCIQLEVETYDIELSFDNLNIYEGEGNDLNLLTTVSGQGWETLVNTDSDCITIGFTSDASQNGAGFRVNWKCTLDDCPIIEEVTPNNPVIIDNLPFEDTDVTTCFAGNNIETTPCSDDDFLEGKEYIYAYSSLGDECISVNVTGVIPRTGITILRGNPDSDEAVCINLEQAEGDESTLFLPNVSLKEKGTYYFIIANENNCTPFDISIVPSERCPTLFPSAAKCKDALILNGCNPELPAALTVEPGAGDPDFFKTGVNNGCWDDIFETNFTWFTFEAQGDGEFAFLLSNNDTTDVVDIDFNIWGPLENLEDACFDAENTQPIRSSFADDLVYSITGLANTNPVLGTPVTSTCQGAESEGFVKPLQVKKGEIYVVLINDFDGVIFDGAIAIDFVGTTPGVLTSIPGTIANVKDTFICAGDSLTLSAEGASIYDWSPAESLSCRSCPNPIASPTETTTYTLEAGTVCSTVEESIRVEVIKAAIGPDQTVCQGAILPLNVDTDAQNVVYQWMSPNGLENLSCIDCPNPTLTAIDAGNFEYIVLVSKGGCSVTDTLQLTVIEGKAPVYTLVEQQAICQGDTLSLGGNNPLDQTYLWTSKDSSFTSADANPVVSPTNSTTYYLSVSTEECTVDALDSIFVEVDELPIISLISDTTICQETSILLSEELPQVGVTYEWVNTENFALDNPNIPNTIARPINSTTYTLTAINGACSISESVAIEVIPANVAFENEMSSIALCLGESIDVNLLVNPSNSVPTVRSLDATFNSNSDRLIVNPAINQTYIASIDINGCMAMDTLVVQVDSLPPDLAIFPIDTTLCEPTQLILSSPIYDPQFYPNLQHQWLPNIGFDSPDSFYNLVVTATESVELKRVNKNGACVDTSYTNIDITNFENTTLENFDTNIIFIGQSIDFIELQTVIPDIVGIEWTENGQGIESAVDSRILKYTPFANTPITETERTAIIEAFITTAAGCNFTAALNISIQPPFLPDVITPNGDNTNDVFEIPVANLKNVRIKIFNRWGDKVFESDNYQNDWAGTQDGNPLPPGPYYFVYEEEGAVPLTGCVSIVR